MVEIALRNKGRTTMYRVFAIAFAICLTGAAGATAQGKTQKISKKLVNKAKDTAKEIEKVTKQLDKTMDQQRKLLSKKKVKDRRKEYKKLQNELEKMEEAVTKVRKKAEEMEKEADKFFTEWNQGLARIGNEELRALSQDRFNSSRIRYAQIIVTGRLAATHYDDFASNMKNELSYLELDMSDEAIALLGPKVEETASKARELKLSVDNLTGKIEGYLFALQ